MQTLTIPICAAALMAMAQDAAAQIDCGVFEAVEPGDTIETISRRCDIDPAQLMAGNPEIERGAALRSGTVLIVGPARRDRAAVQDPGLSLRLQEVTRDPAASAPVPVPLEGSAPVPIAPEPAELPEFYISGIQGLWREVGGSCAVLESTWAFGATQMRENTVICDVGAVSSAPGSGTAEMQARCTGPGAAERGYVLTPNPDGSRMTIQGSLFQTNLERCAQ